MNRIIIVGGGASGIAAALSAAQAAPRAEITVLEGLDRIGKKILATGNGRCNLGNEEISADCYFGARRDRLAELISDMPTEKTVEFFKECGLLCAPDEAGRLYPYCRQASMVLDVLLLALQRRRIAVECDCRVTAIQYKKGRFQVKTEAGERFEADRVILATGGKAAPKQGVTGVGYTLAESFGHRKTALFPCLVPIKCRSGALKGLKGIRVQCRTTLLEDGAPAASEIGELQLTDYGVSGIPALQLSCTLGALRGKAEISVDFFPETDEEALYEQLKNRRDALGGEALETVFLGTVHKRILYTLMKEAGLEPLSRKAKTLEDGELRALARKCKDWRLPMEGTLSWDQAQVTGGGIPLQEVTDDFESVYQKGLYLTGELLDAVGLCGGYNLHWAWCSGIRAGQAAAQEEDA